jgi:hypothetical protein
MWSFFNGWRRKAGVASLVMACAVFGIWMRSRVVQDTIVISLNGYSHFIVSEKDRVWWFASPLGDPPLILWTPGPLTPITAGHYVLQKGNGSTMQIEMDTMWFGVNHIWLVSYWSVVLGLTLLSAYLILRKPRKAKSPEQPAISNLISNRPTT